MNGRLIYTINRLGPAATLTIDDSQLSDPDGLLPNTRVWQWSLNGVALPDATGPVLKIAEGNFGDAYALRYSIKDGSGASETQSVTLHPFGHQIRGTAGNDWTDFVGGIGDKLDGLGGNDMLSMSSARGPVLIDLAKQIANVGSAHSSVTNYERVTGSAFGDTLAGDQGNNQLRGMGDYDWLVGSGGSDTFDGGSGLDTVAYSAATTGVTANLSTRQGTRGQAAGDHYVSVENLTGGSHADTLTGDDQANRLRGLGGDDLIFGGGGKDRVDGGPGNDSLYGGAGSDRITGGGGRDFIDGGAGYDTAIFAGARDDYAILRQGGTVTLQHRNGGADGTDLLIGVEVLSFSDGDYIL